ncbi:tRNA glutamyl-Q(34) synthetase GluQRS [Aestuariicoccus sp. MJ-SS9]|uniref:tRNA glutamyl-Q(34) synthetase GluQRS n=1 Tax=Aestuariicoccus sp. MJ-SS9 TaxID=3079855 RepID=UPI0029114863|nr:tRNA glutamyl-Q(34) synthetase GluQRS [Aestuariicoccus sp. MJ-SS9]MDU8911559.1 tRNA glutamyl-Q(34) synthetase GluQRS [Aestuariicoccus sp. MJ-SS9]
MIFVTRFAPSPTGPLHLGHAFSALLAHDRARSEGGQFLLRIEDIDTTRSRPEWEAQIYDDLHWLEIDWDAPPMRQSERVGAYEAALDRLWGAGLLYPCSCTRRDIAAATAAPQEGDPPLIGPDGLVYPGTCRDKPRPPRRPGGEALRIDMRKALERIDPNIVFREETRPDPIHRAAQTMIEEVGDVVLSRRDFVGSYHLSVVLDDAAQGITHVIRGADLFDATPIHVMLQRLLGLPTPVYHHHRLIRDETGRRLAKRDDARAIATYRAEGRTPADIRAMVGL